MASDKVRRQIAWEAARLMYSGQESEYYQAKLKAGRRICRGWVKPSFLPTNAEIRDQVQMLARLHEGETRNTNLSDMRLDALRIMRRLEAFRPRLIGSTLTGHVREGSDIDIHLFSDGLDGICAILDEDGLTHEVERKRVRKDGEERVYTHVHVDGRFPIELTVYPACKAHVNFRSSITGRKMERATIADLEELLERETSEQAAQRSAPTKLDRFLVYENLLAPLEEVKQSPEHHPEGDALYHSLQVFDLMCDEAPNDEELLLAALLHDVGKAIDPHDHTAAALDSLRVYITPRTFWLIEHHMHALALRHGTIGVKLRQRLQQSEYYQDLLLLGECDRRGRRPGVAAPSLDEAIAYLRQLAKMCDE